MTYPYVASPDKLKSLLKMMATEVGIPNKFDIKFLKSLGFTSSNDKRLLLVIKFIGLAEEKGAPTDLWRDLRGDSKVAIARGIRRGYADLFSHYPDAQLRDDEAIRTFFSANTSLGSQAVGRIVRTFRTLCEMADFSDTKSAAPAKAKPATKPSAEVSKPGATVQTREVADGLTVNINVQLQVPPDATGEIYDKFFEAMRKHLWPPPK